MAYNDSVLCFYGAKQVPIAFQCMWRLSHLSCDNLIKWDSGGYPEFWDRSVGVTRSFGTDQRGLPGVLGQISEGYQEFWDRSVGLPGVLGQVGGVTRSFGTDQWELPGVLGQIRGLPGVLEQVN